MSQLEAQETGVVREKIEWLDLWQPDSDRVELAIPRVLLIGDSISVGYGSIVDQQLAGRASVSRLSTSRFIADPVFGDELLLVLRRTKFAMIHFNNGLHGFENSEALYAEHVSRILNKIAEIQPQAKMILATSTPQRDPENRMAFHSRAERIQQRNQILCAAAAERALPINDLYALVLEHPEYYVPDAIHFNETGRKVQGRVVAKAIEAML